MVFDKNDPVIDEVDSEKHDWSSSEFSYMQGEVLPGNMQELRGLDFVMK